MSNFMGLRIYLDEEVGYVLDQEVHRLTLQRVFTEYRKRSTSSNF